MAERDFAEEKTQRDRLIVAVLTLCGAMLRLWRLEHLGLSYDEAATALMAQASAGEIVEFHWRAGFEHPPLWQLTAHLWSQMAGQSEYALRFLPALAGILAVPLIWQFARSLYPKATVVRHVSTGLAVLAPVLIYYSQEARMYTIVLTLALGSMIAVMRLLRRPTWSAVVWLALLNGLLTGFHYYAALLLVAEGIFFLVALRPSSTVRGHWRKWVTALGLSALPLLLWMAFSPGFHLTLQSVLRSATVEATPVHHFADGLWRDLSVAAIRWQPTWSWIGYLLLPLLVIGLVDALWLRRRDRDARLSGWYLFLLLFVPLFFSALLFGGLSTRYVLYVEPALLILFALGIVRLSHIARPLGAAGAMLYVGVCVAALFYYATDYAKSEYREMSAILEARVTPEDGILLESPRQHLLAKYYLDIDKPLYPVPQIKLPAYWPVTAPPVVPEDVDGEIQAYLRRHPQLWLSLTAQDEVDLGEFVPKYLTAVAYEVDCDSWLDVDLCQYASPWFLEPAVTETLDVRYEGGLALQGMKLAVLQGRSTEPSALLVELDWLAEVQPQGDYKVSLRLTDAAGEPIVQRDSYPIGPLLPPSTWSAGDRKPGYMALTLPPQMSDGDYQLAVTLYDPETLASLTHSTDEAQPSTAPLLLANVRIGDTIDVERTADEPR